METLIYYKGGNFMSKYDYTKYSKQNQNEVEEVGEELETELDVTDQTEFEVEPEIETDVETDAETEVETKHYDLGVVTGCAKLRVRSEPRFGTNVVCEIERGTRVMIDKSESTFDYYKIYTESGVEGFCVKTYIA
jgi:hypothetical protein